MASTLDANLSLSILNTSQEQDEANVLYIENAGSLGDTLILGVSNIGNPIPLYRSETGFNGNAQQQNYSFYLYFQPSTVLQGMDVAIFDDKSQSYVSIPASSEWKSQQFLDNEGGLYIYFLATSKQSPTGETGEEIINIEGKKAIQIRLTNVVAAPGVSRASNVELHIRDTSQNEFFCQTYLNVINHQGQRKVPIVVTIEVDQPTGSPLLTGGQICNDGITANHVVLKIFNTGNDTLDFSTAKIQLTFTKSSQLYALINSGDPIPDNIRIFGQTVNSSIEGNNPIYTFQNNVSTLLQPGEHQVIEIPGLKTSLPPGIANLYINYYDVPGYWDGTLAVPLLRSSLLVNSSGKVGIGTNAPTQLLHLETKTSQYGLMHTDGTVELSTYVGTWGSNSARGWLGTKSNHPFSLFTNADGPSLSIDTNGNVGIGTIDPTQLLHLETNTDQYGLMHTDGTVELSTYISDKSSPNEARGWLGTKSNHPLSFFVNSGEPAITVDTKGNVGIGKDNPEDVLDVEGNIRLNDNDIYFRGGGDIHHGLGWHGSTDTAFAETMIDGPVLYGYNGGALGSNGTQEKIALIWNNEGNIGIGTNSPGKGKLEISGYQDYGKGLSYGWLNNSSHLTGHVSGNSYNSQYSLYASARIGAAEFNAFSDARTKNIKGLSSGRNDLEVLMQIEVVDYCMINTIHKNSHPYKKVIGQQIAKIYPQAVSNDNTDVVPDIYQVAMANEGWIALHADLQVGERIQVFTEKERKLCEILEVSESGVRIDLPDDTERIFVYGREVDDFHIVDYDAIAMLNVSATQELYRKIISQESTIDTLQKELEKLKEHFATSLNIN